MHSEYYAGKAGKEFRLPSGKRIDFLDVENGAIRELKPNNPRAIKQGWKQLETYRLELESPATLQMHPRLQGIKWKKVLDTY
ncbi:MAG: hypothetical protein IPJ30_14875 [Acidobacteria bacterium]|nr:hypothetical protein [Acidobacteriota bacterium]